MQCEECGKECEDDEALCPECVTMREESNTSNAEPTHIARIQPKKLRVELSQNEQEVLKRQRAEYEAGKVVRSAEEHQRDLELGSTSRFPFLLMFILFDVVLLILLFLSF